MLSPSASTILSFQTSSTRSEVIVTPEAGLIKLVAGGGVFAINVLVSELLVLLAMSVHATLQLISAPVATSNTKDSKFPAVGGELSVWFKSRKTDKEHYVYSNVSVVTFGELINSTSKGRYFIANIKGNSFEKIN